MIAFLADLALRASVLLALGWIAAWACARARASVRHAIWAAMFAGMMMLPPALALLPAVGLPLGQAAVPAVPGGFGATERIGAPPGTRLGSQSAATPPSERGSAFPWAAAAGWLWFGGALVLLLNLGGECWRIRRVVLGAEPLGEGVARTCTVRVAQVVGALRPTILVPPEFANQPRERQQAILRHERAHVARRDCLWLLVARAGCVLYWWNPLAWHGARALRAAGEQAADDRVLANGAVPTLVYAGHLVASARALRPGAALSGAMAATSNLEQRVRAILDPLRRRQPLGRAAAAGMAALLAGFVVSLAAMQVVPRSGPVETDKLPAFEAASVRPTGPMIGEHNSEHDDPVHMTMRGTLHRIILYAYGISDHEISGEPNWFRGEGWAIDTVSARPSTQAEKMLMLRRLLAERFQLKLEMRSTIAPMYALTIAPGGAKFPALAAAAPAPKKPPEAPNTFALCFDTVPPLLNVLNGVYGGPLRLDRQVLDRTGLTGRYALCFTTAMVPSSSAAGGRSFPNLEADLSAQLGLRLIPVRAPETIYIVTHSAKPAAN
ncbi:MAG TPA: M56 family metallopeptidase [Terriglobales bacterium]|nr:M56 family metallopeptidase [Terriglobales bacterium]